MWQCMQMEVSLQFAVLEWVNKRQDLDTCTLEIKEHKSDVKDVVCLPGDELLASACSDGKINLCDFVSGQVMIEIHGHEGEIRNMDACRHGTRLVSGGEDRTVRVWDTRTGQPVCVLQGHSVHNPRCTCQHSSFGYVANAACPVQGHSATVRGVRFSPLEPHVIASCSNDKTIKIWRLVQGANSHELGDQDTPVSLEGHGKPVSSIAFSCAQAHTLASGSEDRTIKIWDTTTGGCNKSLSAGRGVTSVVCILTNVSALVHLLYKLTIC